MEKSALPFSRSLRKVEASALLAKCWLASPRGFAPKRLFNNPRDPGNGRSAQFNLSTIPQKSRASRKMHPRRRAIRRPNKGGLAQLVERLLCKQNVNGSNPLTSTTRKSRKPKVESRNKISAFSFQSFNFSNTGPVAQLVRAPP